MRLMRVGEPGAETPVAVDAQGDARDISALIADVTGLALHPAELHRLQGRVAPSWSALPAVDLTRVRVAPPVGGIGKVVCVGLNFRKHAREAGLPIPDEPILFMKAADTVGGAYDPVLIPPTSSKTDYEVELAVIIGRTARYLQPTDDVTSYIAGYAISNDVSEREYQLERGGQWDKGKNCETFNPLGPVLVTSDDIADVQNLRMSLSVNGEIRQDSSTADMIFPVDFIVRYISQFMTLYPGDVINTGTPEGVGSGFVPPRFLAEGDEVTVEIEGLGRQTQRFARATVEADA